jgi:hypothetical protein
VTTRHHANTFWNQYFFVKAVMTPLTIAKGATVKERVKAWTPERTGEEPWTAWKYAGYIPKT